MKIRLKGWVPKSESMSETMKYFFDKGYRPKTKKEAIMDLGDNIKFVDYLVTVEDMRKKK